MGAQPPTYSRMEWRWGGRRWGFVLESKSGTAHPMRLFPRKEKKKKKKGEAQSLPKWSLEPHGIGIVVVVLEPGRAESRTLR